MLKSIFRLLGSSNAIRREAKLKSIFKRFFADESGATAIEYGLIAAGISLAIITVVAGLGSNLNGKFTTVKNALQ